MQETRTSLGLVAKELFKAQTAEALTAKMDDRLETLQAQGHTLVGREEITPEVFYGNRHARHRAAKLARMQRK
jgi:hypothetical protein